MEFFVIDHDNFYSCVKCNEMFLCESEVGIYFAITSGDKNIRIYISRQSVCMKGQN